MAKLFGTDGIRGPAGQFPLDAMTVKALGASLINHLRQKTHDRAPVIVIGQDTRESGAWLEQAFIQGAAAAGAECKSAGVIPTPGIAFLARTLPADAGIVISASHNPYYDNGVKIFSPSGKKLEDATERLIEADLLRTLERPDVTDVGRAKSPLVEPLESENFEAKGLRERYLNFLAGEIASGLTLKDRTVVIDCANGAASGLAPELFTRLGAKVIAINNSPDGRNINANCGSMHIEGLQQRVLLESADLGIAFDGDADRALFVDANGTFVDGDATLWVLANYLSARGQLRDGIVVATVMSNIGLEIALHSRGLKLLRADVGDKYVLEELLRTRATLGGEQSGHLIFPELSLAGDGMITALYLLRAMSEHQSKLHELTEGFNRFPQVLVNVKVREKKPFADIESVQEITREIQEKLGGEGRLLLRYSGTESLARVMIEGPKQREIEEYAAKIADAIKDAIG
jgi:phosphoglucosamine mutase